MALTYIRGRARRARGLARGGYVAWWAAARAAPRRDLVAYGMIVCGGALVLVLFLFAHLGLGALLVPPVASARAQVVTAGPYRVRLVLDADVMTVGRQHTATITLSDSSGHTVTDAVVRVQPVMTSMPMSVPPAQVDPIGGGQYRMRPIWSMAGEWRLDVTIARRGQVDQHASFVVAVRWS